MSSYSVISADNHVFEPADLWATRADPKIRDRAPHVVSHEDGDWWVCDGHKVLGVGFGTQVGRRFEAPEKLSTRDTFDNVRPGGFIPEEHVKDLDIDGVERTILYPTVGLLLHSVPDGELLTSVFSTYNTWLGEFCKPFPNRLDGIAMLNVDDVPSAVKELERSRKMGLIGAMITVYPPEERHYGLPEYDSLWAAAQDLQMPLSLHAGTVRHPPDKPFSQLNTLGPNAFVNMEHWVRESLTHIIFGGVFDRYPKLMVGAIEHELSWVPNFLDRMDYTYNERLFNDELWDRFKSDMLPSDYFHRNVFLGFQEDALGIRLRDIIGVDKLQWGSDYPHHESTFPRSREILEEILADCTEEEKAKIAGGNAARLYNLE